MAALRTIEVEVDASGKVHPIDDSDLVPPGRALLTLLPATDEPLNFAETSLATDWLLPEEDAAWAHLQPGK